MAEEKNMDEELEDITVAEEAAEEEAVEDTAEDTAEAEEPEEADIDTKKEAKKKKDKKDEQIEELTDKVKRQMAEFENFRKRSEREKTQMYEVGAKSILEKILPIVDNFERGLAGMEDSEDSFAQGMQMIYKQLMTSLEEAGVTAIEAVGKDFDPEFHNAVMHVEDENFGENEVVEELQKGYMYRESVIRHSMVKVAN